jgi:hypothetical protein
MAQDGIEQTLTILRKLGKKKFCRSRTSADQLANNTCKRERMRGAACSLAIRL